jgi:A/G-specific adenine glycosylase
MDPDALLRWYRPRRRRYPWRRPRPDPYHVLVSEVMLQQTQAPRVVPAFRSFIARFPSVSALAIAPRREVLSAWGGLGYNRRAVWLSEAARRIVGEHGGRIPDDPDDLLRLPGIGPYTAAAVAAIAYGVPAPAIDTNARRVVARAALGIDGSEASPSNLRRAARRWMDGAQPGAWNQAVMDLGRDVCRPIPACEACPLSAECAFVASGRMPAARRPGKSERFEGSFRQLRGAIVRVLRERPSASIDELSRLIAQPAARVVEAVDALDADGLVSVAGLSGGIGARRVRLPG